MPTDSPYPAVDIPHVDLWGLMFEHKRKEGFSDQQGKLQTLSPLTFSDPSIQPTCADTPTLKAPANFLPPTSVIYRALSPSRYYTHATVKSTALAFGEGLRDAWEWQKGDILTI